MSRLPAALAAAALGVFATAAPAEPMPPPDAWSVGIAGGVPGVILSDQGAAARITLTPLPPVSQAGDNRVDLIGYRVVVDDPTAGPFTFSGNGVSLDVTLTDFVSGKSWTGEFGFGVETVSGVPGQVMVAWMTPAILFTPRLGPHEYHVSATGGGVSWQGTEGTLGVQVSVSQVPAPSALALAVIGAAFGVWRRVRPRSR